ncbi:MAG: hypothetical protein ACF8LK_02230 [Phycisphaerales bacterium JB041]
MPRTVVLRHDLPDGSHHYDWLIEPMGPAAATAGDETPAPDRRNLIAWRLPDAPFTPARTTMPVDRLPPHRRMYLDYEGPISGGRGSVLRVARGDVEVLADSAERFEACGQLDGRAFRISATPSPTPGDAQWRLTVVWG